MHDIIIMEYAAYNNMQCIYTTPINCMTLLPQELALLYFEPSCTAS